MPAWVYMVRCRDGSLYTGVSADLDARVAAHNAGRGAKYTRSRRPVALVWCARAKSLSEALRREWRLKRWSRARKLALLKSAPRTPRSRAGSPARPLATPPPPRGTARRPAGISDSR
ncbi:MAG: GIY-YIG nuclease family protein [Planctomycetes bacterium]|nr:GIY-YIG nuclease family protein [Planctomycetota bacterium]